MIYKQLVNPFYNRIVFLPTLCYYTFIQILLLENQSQLSFETTGRIRNDCKQQREQNSVLQTFNIQIYSF